MAREVGTEGQLGGQAEVPAVAGTWKDLTDSVNAMAGNLTGQVRAIAQVTTAVAKGDLSQKISVEAKGEVATLAETINGMVDTLSAFAGEVTRVAREVGTEGRLGGQAEVPGVGRHLAGPDRVGELHGGQPHQPGPQHRPGDHRRRQGRPEPEDHRRRARRDPRAQEHREHDGGPAVRVRRRGHPHGPRGGHRGPPRRPGAGPRRRRHLAGPDRLGELHGGQPHQPGPLDRPGGHRGGQGRPEPEDHGRRARRDPRAQEHDQHDGRHAVRLRRRGHPDGPRGGHRGPPRRPGRRAGRVRHLEGPDRVGQRHGGQPDRAGPRRSPR